MILLASLRGVPPFATQQTHKTPRLHHLQGVETHKGRNQKNLGWASTAVHAGIGAVCLFKGFKEGVPK